MVQRGSGAMVHYPIPEQLARNEIPVFVQVRSSAPIDHVSMFYRGQGATRYREVRMTSAGSASLSLPNGYGANIPCEDAFPPAVEYYVQAIDTSGAAVGGAGSSTQPISLPIVTQRHFNIVPTMPGQPAPRSCGTLEVALPTSSETGGGSSTGGTSTHNAEPVTGTADLGEPCQTNRDCRHGLRCGSTHTCVFVQSN
jgi:hypothetical protein